MSSTPALSPFIADITSMYGCGWTADQLYQVQACIADYSEREGFVGALRGLVFRIWNLIKGIFGQSDWQRTARFLAKEFDGPDFGVAITKKLGPKVTPYVLGEHFLKQCITYNELGLNPGLSMFAEFFLPHVLLPTMLKRFGSDANGNELSEWSTLRKISSVITTITPIVSDFTTQYNQYPGSDQEYMRRHYFYAFVDEVFKNLVPAITQRIKEQHNDLAPGISAVLTIVQPILQKLADKCQRGELTMDDLKGEALVFKDIYAVMPALFQYIDTEVAGKSMIPTGAPPRREVTDRR